MSLLIDFMMAGDATVLGAGPGGTISQLDPSSTYDTTVGIRFNTNGTIDTGKQLDGGGITWTSAGTWIDPTGNASNAHDVRFTSFVSGASSGDWTSEAAADDVWITLVDGVRTWIMNSTIAETRDFTCNFEVRDGDGAPPTTATASYTFRIINSA